MKTKYFLWGLLSFLLGIAAVLETPLIKYFPYILGFVSLFLLLKGKGFLYQGLRIRKDLRPGGLTPNDALGMEIAGLTMLMLAGAVAGFAMYLERSALYVAVEAMAEKIDQIPRAYFNTAFIYVGAVALCLGALSLLLRLLQRKKRLG